MLELEPALAERLRHHRIRIELPDGDTVLIRRVPINKRYYTKPRTNVLVKRPAEGLPFIVCVDADLAYLGKDRKLVNAFSGAVQRQGWQILILAEEAMSDFQQAVRMVLSLLGVDAAEPSLAPPPESVHRAENSSVLARFGVDLTRLAVEGSAASTVGRADEIEEVLACLCLWQARLPVIVGESGVGKTNLLHAVARELLKHRPELRLIVVNLGELMAGTVFDAARETRLAALLDEAAAMADLVLAFENFEAALAQMPGGRFLISQALDRGLRLVGTLLPGHRRYLTLTPLARRIQPVELNELSAAEAERILCELRERIARHHQVEIPETIIRTAVEAAELMPGVFPAKAIALLDTAAARTGLAGKPEIRSADLLLAT
jgi:ATP-dependent Clp protease ATP-binding subunit ClpA